MDTILFENTAIPVAILNHSGRMNWEPYFLLLATLSLMAAVIIPFAQNKYDAYRTKRNFKIYFKKKIGFIFNYLANEKIEYQEPSTKEQSSQVKLELFEFIKRFENDFKHHKDTVHPMLIFSLLMNLQNFLLFSFRLRNTIKIVDFNDLLKLTLEHGNKLSKHELSNIYELIIALETFVSSSLNQDRFGEIKSVRRVTQKGVWVGLETDKDFQNQHNFLNHDLKFVNEHEDCIAETSVVVQAVDQNIKAYFLLDENTLKNNTPR